MTTSRRKIVLAVSDAVLGYGSPQIPEFMRSVCEEIDATAMVIEPDVPSSPPRHDLYPDITVHRVMLERHVFEAGGRNDYCREAARLVDRIKPDVLVIFCTFALPTLLWNKHKPKAVIYYSIESILQYGWRDIHLNNVLRDRVDMVIFPEENRAARDLDRTGLPRENVYILLNSSNGPESASAVLPPDKRNGRIIHQGTVGTKETFSEYFTHPKIQRLPIDVYGPIVDEGTRQRFGGLGREAGGTTYRGRVNLDLLTRIRHDYCYSICIWDPTVERGLFAPSNKFFEAVADGVPPITAPHPQHARLVHAYDCGIVMNGWDFRDFRAALLQALRILKTPRYAEMVENCRRAVRAELNWKTQMEQIFPSLRKLVGLPPRSSSTTELEPKVLVGSATRRDGITAAG
jgi:hypothetical protein